MSVVRPILTALALGLLAAAPAHASWWNNDNGGWSSPRPRPSPTPSPSPSSSGGAATPVPAPAGLGLFALGLAGMAIGRRGFRRG